MRGLGDEYRFYKSNNREIRAKFVIQISSHKVDDNPKDENASYLVNKAEYCLGVHFDELL